MPQSIHTLTRSPWARFLHHFLLGPLPTRSGPLFKASVEGDVAYVELLVSNGMDPNVADYNQRSPLHLAASNGHLSIVQLLCMQPVSSASPHALGPGGVLCSSATHPVQCRRPDTACALTAS